MRARAIDERTHAVEVVAFLVAVGFVASSTSPFHANQTTPRPPVIDMHAHFTGENGPRIMDAVNIRYVLLAGDPAIAILTRHHQTSPAPSEPPTPSLNLGRMFWL